jgi:hypothetical protein
LTRSFFAFTIALIIAILAACLPLSTLATIRLFFVVRSGFSKRYIVLVDLRHFLQFHECFLLPRKVTLDVTIVPYDYTALSRSVVRKQFALLHSCVMNWRSGLLIRGASCGKASAEDILEVPWPSRIHNPYVDAMISHILALSAISGSSTAIQSKDFLEIDQTANA